ncbi:hypothetical protein LI328DRAFT_133020 [Trichoderma asperelloides]|nr:hypothetical protein LI328DRAFT_133020 [Trichoderma asperelloides]
MTTHGARKMPFLTRGHALRYLATQTTTRREMTGLSVSRIRRHPFCSGWCVSEPPRDGYLGLEGGCQPDRPFLKFFFDVWMG